MQVVYNRGTFCESSDPHLVGPVVLQLTPEGLGWWWEGREANLEPDGFMPVDELVKYGYRTHESIIDYDVALAAKHLKEAADRIAWLRQILSAVEAPDG